MEQKISRPIAITILLNSALAFYIFYLLANHRNIDGDEGLYLEAARLVSHGKKLYLDISAKALTRIRAELKQHTRQFGRDLPAMVAALNPYICGVRQYFHRVVRRRLAKLDRFVIERLARWWRRKHGRAAVSWWLVRGTAIWSEHGLDRFYVRRFETR